MSEIPDYVRSLINTPFPKTVGEKVIRFATPVVAFGRFRNASIATLGINPSKNEFFDANGKLLTGKCRRLSTTESLGIASCITANDHHINQIIDDCECYFDKDRNAYRTWFNPLDKILQAATGRSYYDGTACHIDLLPWATDPIWRKLEPEARRGLIDDGREFTTALIDNNQFEILVLNGRSVIEAFSQRFSKLEIVKAINMINAQGRATKRTCTIYRGAFGKRVVIGWSTNLQSSRGVSNPFLRLLAEETRKLLVDLRHGQPELARP